MANRFLVRTRAGDHIATDEAMILDWLKQGHCGAGDFVYVEANGAWIPVCELPGIQPLFAAKPGVKLEKPVITVFKLGYGKSLQQGPFTLSTVFDMLARGDLCASSWIFIDGDKEWRQVKNVKVLREVLPATPAEPPRFELTDVSRAPSPPQELELSVESLQNGFAEAPPSAPIAVTRAQPAAPTGGAARAYATARVAVPEALMAAEAGATSVFEESRDSQPSIVPMPEGLKVELPVPAAAAVDVAVPEEDEPPTATLTKTAALAGMNAALAGANAEPPTFAPTTNGFVPQPDLSGAAAAMPAAGAEGGGQVEVSVRLEPVAKTRPGGVPTPLPAMPTAPAPPKAPAPPAMKAPAAIDFEDTDATAGAEGEPRFSYRQSNHIEEIPEDEQTKAVSKLGLAETLSPQPDFQQHARTTSGFVPAPGMGQAPPAVPTPPPVPGATATKPKIPFPPSSKAPSVPPPAPPAAARPPLPMDESTDDGIIVEIPQGPIWLIKQDRSERLSGPYTFQQIIDLLKTGQLTKEDKISKQGTNRFAKLGQQYEFNVKYTVETVVEGGVERQKILIKRRHPRAPYMSEVHVMKVGRKWLGKCVNISAGGILLESTDLEAALGDTVMIEIMAGAIPRKISASALVIGRIPKKPPGYALRFVDLKTEDKEAIEFFVMENLKKEKAMGI